MPSVYRDTVTEHGRFDRAALMRLAVAKARIERGGGTPWPQAIAYGLAQVWEAARALRAHAAESSAVAKLPPHERQALRCDTAALLAETAIPPRRAEARLNRQRAADLRDGSAQDAQHSSKLHVASLQSVPGEISFAGDYARLAGMLKSDLASVAIDLDAALRALQRGQIDVARSSIMAAHKSAEIGQMREAGAVANAVGGADCSIGNGTLSRL